MRPSILVWAALLASSVALAQDQPPPPPSAPPRAAAPRAAALPDDPELKQALDQAAWARKRALCLERGAAALELAARRLATAPDAERLARKQALHEAMNATTACDGLGTIGSAPSTAPSTTPSPARIGIHSARIVEPPCQTGDPLCSDIDVDDKPVLHKLHQERGRFGTCFRGAGHAPGSVSLRLAIARFGDHARPAAVKIVKQTMQDPSVAPCLQRVASRIVFPASAAGRSLAFTVGPVGSER
jgi:hypothetical protein